MAYKALDVIALPIVEDGVATGQSLRKEPGDKITKKEMEEAGQTEESIKVLIEAGSIEETS